MPGRTPGTFVRALSTALLLASSITSVTAIAVLESAAPAAAVSATARFVPTPPCRLADERAGLNTVRLDAQIVRVEVRGKCGVPTDATAVAMTVTVDSSLTQGAGYISVWPEGQPIPTASTINYFQGQVRANGTIVGLQAPGTIAVLSSNAAPVVIDVTGWFVPAATSRAGRFVPVSPTRALDTREAPRAQPMAPGETLTVPLPSNVPVDASAVALTVTLTESTGPGYFSLSPAGASPSNTSIVNADGARQTRAAGSIVAVSAEGLSVFSRSGGHVLIDITGWFTGDTAPDDDDGLFVAADAPRRLVDTRNGDPLWPAGTIEIANVDPNAAALAVNVALVNPMRATYLTAYPSRQPLPTASSVNATSSSEIAASMAIPPVSAAGLAVYSSGGSDVIVDLAGWFTGTPVAASGSAPGNQRPPDCARSTEPADLTALFARNTMFTGADYQRPFALPDGRVLWFFQDMYISGRHGQSTFVHNAGLIQSDNCFQLLHGGDYARPTELLMSEITQRRSRWFWPLGGAVGHDGLFHVFVAEMRERGATYLTKVEPVATWEVTIDLTTLRLVDAYPAVNSSAALYGWSVASDNQYTYLYAHCYRQFGWDAFPFSNPPVYVHDWECADEVTVGRVPLGRFDLAPQYWDGASWQADPGRAASVVPTGRLVSASQFYRDGNRWISVTKVADWFGSTVTIDVASRPQGPFTTVRTINLVPKCGECNTYFAALLPWRSWNGDWLLAISNNRFDRLDLGQYQPTFFATAPV